MKRVLMVLTSVTELAGEPTGYELSEAAHPWKVFRDAGHVVDFASIDGGLPEPASTDDADEISEEFMADELVNAQLLATPAVADVDPEQYDAIYLVGGHGTMVDFPASDALKQALRAFALAGKPVAAVCHGPAGLLDVELDNGLTLLTGKEVAGFSNTEEEAVGKTAVVPFSLQDKLEAEAEKYTSAPDFEEHVVADGTLVTGQNPASAAGVAKEVNKLLAADIEAEKADEEQAAAALRAEKDAEKEAAEAEADA